jgi:16S rRNA (guanine1207-N2)-methyltransferase
MTHYFINDNKLESNIKDINIIIKEKTYKINTDNGVFSKKGLDFGTRMLLDNIPLDKIKGNVLDMGCGYGIIGIFIADNTNSIVDMVDVNLRAIHLAKMNAKENKINNVNIYESNIYENVTKKYSFIITNPPIRAGKQVVYDIIFKAKEYLNDSGELWFVIRKEQGAKTLLKAMDKEYVIEIVEKNKGFFVVSAKIR